MKKIILYYHTLKYLKGRQVFYRIFYFVRRIIGIKGRNIILNKTITTESIDFPVLLQEETSYKIESNKFTFINLSHTFSERIDWNFFEHGKLWNYNLNYFNYLNQKDEISLEEGLVVINSFISSFDSLSSGADPYPTSLRIINWIKFLARHKIKDKKIDDSLYHQTTYLRHNLEFHLLGNHLLENAFALVFASCYFQDDSLFVSSKKLLVDELNEQILSDGAHFELSPMYHQIMLFRILDTYNLLVRNDTFNKDLEQKLKSEAELMLGWLQQISFSNGDIPLVNDSAFGISPTTSELIEYGRKLGLNPSIVTLKESGYRKFVGRNYEVIADVGRIGPDYIPGHAHCDALNFVMYVDGCPFIVDTGTSTYESGERRNLERSTFSHNTVSFGDYEQSEMWGSFRAGRRVIPSIEYDTKDYLSASIKYVTTTAFHKREFFKEDNVFRIIDSVKYNELALAHFFFHPNKSISLEGNDVVASNCTLHFIGSSRIVIEDYFYAPEFNKRINAKKILVYFTSQLETIITPTV